MHLVKSCSFHRMNIVIKLFFTYNCQVKQTELKKVKEQKWPNYFILSIIFSTKWAPLCWIWNPWKKIVNQYWQNILQKEESSDRLRGNHKTLWQYQGLNNKVIHQLMCLFNFVLFYASHKFKNSCENFLGEYIWIKYRLSQSQRVA